MNERKRLDRPKLGNDIVRIVDWQFRRITNLLPSAYADSLKIIKKETLALIPNIEHLLNQLKLADKNYTELKNAFDERIEEAKRTAWNIGYEDGKTFVSINLPDLLKEAEEQERERIIAWGLEPCPHWVDGATKEVGVMRRDCSQCWQALKEGE